MYCRPEEMIYPAEFEDKIGFTTIRSLLLAATLTTMGRTRVAAMGFMTDRDAVGSELCYVAQLRTLMETAALPLSHLDDPAPVLIQIKTPGNYAAPGEIMKIRRLLEVGRSVAGYLAEAREHAPQLASRFGAIPDVSAMIRAIDGVLDKIGEVRDNASPELADIRRQIRGASASMASVMRRVIERAVTQGVVDSDTTPAMRDGHLVIPVPAAMKRQLPGIIFDQSASGKTWFIEPAQVAEANNRLRELQIAEQKEIVEIMRRLADTLRPGIPAIEEMADEIGVIDFLRAKALLARELDANLPTISGKPQIDWYGAVHPELLLRLRKNSERPVSLDITLTAKQRILVISGPNAGGKSVCLKTVAIVQYMMQCGLLPPLYSNSHMGLFSDIFINIGDQQSIENDLSTYSSHLRNMRIFLSKASSSSLFLIDEMGSGTEPEIGGAIAQAILNRLNDNKVYGVVTTHYRNLKTFASETDGLVNGAMLYDRQQLRPLFRLAIGNPGSSFALEIARKSGMPLEIINNAKEIVGSDYVNIDKYLLDLTRDKKYWAEKRLSVKEKEKHLDQLISNLEGKSAGISTLKAEIINRAKAEAKELLASANAQIENAIRDIRAAQAEKERTKEIRRQLEEYKKSVDAQQPDSAPVIRIPKRRTSDKRKRHNTVATAQPAGKQEFKVGDYVAMQGSSITGQVLAIKGSEAEVAMGAIRTFVPLKSLTAANPPKQTKVSVGISSAAEYKSNDQSRQRQLNFRTELDVRGFRLDEAIQAVTYFIDDATQFSAARVRILHGTGTGALRQGIREYLRSCQQVTSFHDEDVRLGGAGITVVNLN